MCITVDKLLCFCNGPFTGQSLSHDSDQEKTPFSPKKVRLNSRQSFLHGGVFSENLSEEDLASSSDDGGSEVAGGREVVIEDSFQERMRKYDELEVVGMIVLSRKN